MADEEGMFSGGVFRVRFVVDSGPSKCTSHMHHKVFIMYSLWWGEGKKKRPVDKQPPFHGTRCASDPDASSYRREH